QGEGGGEPGGGRDPGGEERRERLPLVGLVREPDAQSGARCRRAALAEAALAVPLVGVLRVHGEQPQAGGAPAEQGAGGGGGGAVVRLHGGDRVVGGGAADDEQRQAARVGPPEVGVGGSGRRNEHHAAQFAALQRGQVGMGAARGADHVVAQFVGALHGSREQ